MCKYCKKLKEFKDLDEEEYLKIICVLKHRDYLSRQIIQKLCDYISNGCPVEKSDVVFSAIGYISSNWVDPVFKYSKAWNEFRKVR